MTAWLWRWLASHRPAPAGSLSAADWLSIQGRNPDGSRRL